MLAYASVVIVALYLGYRLYTAWEDITLNQAVDEWYYRNFADDEE